MRRTFGEISAGISPAGLAALTSAPGGLDALRRRPLGRPAPAVRSAVPFPG